MEEHTKKLRVLIVGCGNMGTAHAVSYSRMETFEIVGLVSKNNSNLVLNEKLGNRYPLFNDYVKAIRAQAPDVVCISTYPDTHESIAVAALGQGCHVFLEKPIADSVKGAERVVEASRKAEKKLVVGYILRHHPSWQKLIQMSHELGKPLVMRMNLNQQSQGRMWCVHRNLLKTLSPIVDCGVHYIDVMCQMTKSRPVRVNAIGARLSRDVPENNYNYGHLHISFEDGSVGWYESGWGPMMSETAFFVKDVIGPNGSISMVTREDGGIKSDAVSTHTKTECLRRHHASLDAQDNFEKPDDWVNMSDEPGHQELCDRQQRFFLDAIIHDTDLSDHHRDAINSLRIAFAADESITKGKTISL